jgi:hypothetical protein
MLLVLGSITPRDDWLMPVYAATATWFGPFIAVPIVPFGMYWPGAVAPLVCPYSRNGTSVP